MTDFTLAKTNKRQIWSKEYASEYVSDTGFRAYMGKTSTDVIRVNTEIKQNGDVVHIPYFTAVGGGVRGDATLEGNEAAMGNYTVTMPVAHVRNAVIMAESDTHATDLDIANIARGSLKDWSATELKKDIIRAGQSVPIKGAVVAGEQPADTYVDYASATAAQRNAYLVNNTDRLLFGNVRANSVSGVFATALSTVTAAQKLSAKTINMAKTMALTSTAFKINPIRVSNKDGRTWFVLFTGPEGFRDANEDELIYAANKDARNRGLDDNPIFQGGDIMYNGVIIREIPEMPLIGNVGASSASIGNSWLCGSQALAVAFSKTPEPRVEKKDYGHKYGVGLTEIRGQTKMSAAGVQTGMVSLCHAASPDAEYIPDRVYSGRVARFGGSPLLFE